MILLTADLHGNNTDLNPRPICVNPWLNFLSMKISITVKPNAKTNEVIQQDDGTFLVKVNAPPHDGKANEKVIELLAKHFSTAKRNVNIISGMTSKKKIVEIEK
ncbi:MAG: DUF167 domain-containing protein [Ignavibacteriales bacterium]|nr:DUF167 domain-containing protein [Ignavibacteriales bacterium]